MNTSKYNLFYVIFCTLFASGCSGTKQVVQKKEAIIEKVTSVPEKNIPQNPECLTFQDLSVNDKDAAETAYVLYKDLYDLKKYKEAYSLWKKAYTMAPASNGKVKYQYDHGITIYASFYKDATDELLKQRYLDTIMMIYDKWALCFGDEATIAGRKAFDYYYNYPGNKTDQEIYALFKENLDQKGVQADYFIFNPMTKLLNDLYFEDKISISDASNTAKAMMSAIEYGSLKCKSNCEAWEVINAYSPARLESLEGEDGFYDCDYYSSKYFPTFEADPTNCEVIQKAIQRLNRGACDINGKELTALNLAYNKHCYTPPPPPGPLKLGYEAYNQGNYKSAVSYFDQYIEASDNNEKKAKYALLISKIYYRDVKNYLASRKYAKRAASYKPNWGEPFMLIGKLYASSGPLCGPGTGWDSQVVTWPAIDKFKYAKKIDPSISAEADKWIKQYQQYMPKKEDVFIRTLQVGGTYKVGCWIQENTTIRTAD